MWPLYVGGFLGPFGGAVVTTMLPEMRDSLGVSLDAVSTSLTAYMVPFALLMLVSGTIAERVGRRLTVRVGYVAYTIASLLCALAPTLGLLLAARALQGAANAFTTPVLVAAISAIVPPERLGRSLGLFGSMQATGQAMAPLLGGLAADFNWSYAFWGSAAVSLVLALLPPQDTARAPAGSGGRWRSLGNRQLGLACVVALLAYMTSMGVTVLGALIAADRFGLGPSARGAVVAVFGVAGLLSGRWLGGLLDRHGRLMFGAAAHLLFGVAAVAMGFSPLLVLLILAVALAGAAGTATRTTAQSLAVTSAPLNRSGATSVMLSFQFGGAALAPLLWVPIYAQIGGAALAVAGLPAVCAGLALTAAVVIRRARPRPARP
jgi:MFS family permease